MAKATKGGKAKKKTNEKKKRGPSDEVTLKDVNDLRPTIPDKVLNKLTKKAKTKAGQRYLDSKQPQVHEPTKQLLLLRGHHVSEKCSKILGQLALVRKPHCVFLNRRNQTRLISPMEDPSDFEYLGNKNDCSIFLMTSSTKKRPCRLVGGRLFDEKIYDLLEFDVREFNEMNCGKSTPSPVLGSKPLVLFQGVCWDINLEMQQAKNFFADLFGGYVADRLLLTGFDHAWICSAYEAQCEITGGTEVFIRLNHYYIELKKMEASKMPRVELTDIGPTFVLKSTRSRLPDKQAQKAAMRLPSQEKLKKTKNVSTNDLAETRGKVWIDKADLSTLHTPHGH
eukprot:Protomagalhaensia_wolfi_Nauph_80__1947@NODE_2227_length_1161_cov_57_254902_g1738_i0_p1_GENE_NODE_2227_length_1161_cov_57_254902_g1738_i0NODE_2227_length_1161_cov_57_254902_g1738_i0_p1_ORF_typecomplete_len338_score52_37Brix/PF04427_18/5_3e21_NODE_2227_length_1161_cov_57_254902_g1738_i0471060